MKYRKFSFRHAEEIFLVDPQFTYLWNEVQDVLASITDQDIIEEFNNEKRRAKSISEAINKLIDVRLKEKGWNAQSYIFADPEYSDNKGTWRLDFAKENIAIEVAFNHGGNVSWNLIKPVLSSELNHVEKAIQTQAGIIISATDEMKKVGGFDGAVGTYEKYVEYLKPLNNILTTPMLIVGLEAPETFKVNHQKEGNTTIGIIEMTNKKNN
jgi:hypothetical protein